MTDTRRAHFSLPGADQMRDHLAANPPQSPSPWFARLPLIALLAIGLLVLLGDTWLSLTLPWVILVGLFVVMAWRGRQVQGLERRVGQCQEWAMRRYYQPALAHAWALLPQITRHPLMRHRLIAVMGHCLDDLARYDAAIEVYDHLLEEVETDHPAAIQLHTHRAIAALGCDRLADADDALRLVRQHIDVKQFTPLTAAYQLARLIQEVRTHHYSEATQRGEGLTAALRPLGAEAGFGHALMAWCHRQQQPAEDGDDPTEAGEHQSTDHAAQMRRWWRRATLLLTPAAIVHRFPELAPLARENPQ